MFEIIIPIFEHLHLAELEQGSPNVYMSRCRTPTEFAEHLLAFNSVCRARARVTESLLVSANVYYTLTVVSKSLSVY